MKSLFTTLLLLCITSTFLIGQVEDDIRFNDLPPNAEYGKCYAKCKTPDIYETFTRKVLVEEAYVKTTSVPAVYETVEKKAMVSEGGVNYKTIPATYKTITEKELVDEEQKIVNIIPANYETRTRKVLVGAETSKRGKKKKDHNRCYGNQKDCMIAHYEKMT